MRRLRAIVNIQADAPVLPGTNEWALRHTVSMVSWAISSAVASRAPERSMNVFIRGAKCSNNLTKAARSCRVATASISRPQPAAAAASSSVGISAECLGPSHARGVPAIPGPIMRANIPRG